MQRGNNSLFECLRKDALVDGKVENMEQGFAKMVYPGFEPEAREFMEIATHRPVKILSDQG